MQETNPIQVVPEVQSPTVSKTSPTPLENNSPKANNFLVILLSILLFISVSISGFFAYQTQKLVRELQENRDTEEAVETTEPTVEPVATEDSEVDPTANWETYTNTKLGFEIKHPTSVKISKEFNDQYNRATEFTGKDTKFSIMLRSGYGIDIKNYFFMDAPISGTTSLAGNPANIYKMPNGYCDGPSCSDPYIAVVTVNGPDLYHLSFFGDDKLSDIEKQILSTFKFIN